MVEYHQRSCIELTQDVFPVALDNFIIAEELIFDEESGLGSPVYSFQDIFLEVLDNFILAEELIFDERSGFVSPVRHFWLYLLGDKCTEEGRSGAHELDYIQCLSGPHGFIEQLGQPDLRAEQDGTFSISRFTWIK